MSKPYKDLKPIDILRNRVTQITGGIVKRGEGRKRLDDEIRELEIMRSAFEEAVAILAKSEKEE